MLRRVSISPSPVSLLAESINVVQRGENGENSGVLHVYARSEQFSSTLGYSPRERPYSHRCDSYSPCFGLLFPLRTVPQGPCKRVFLDKMVNN